MDKTKEWEMEMLMEKLRAKSGQFKSFLESAKALRMALLERRYPVDSVERSQLHKCMDTLQQNIKVTTLQAMVERLESVSRQLGLKFVAGPTGLDWFISSDMFYLEVVLEPSGGVKDVKIHHEGKVEQQSCEELVACLTRRDFADFTAQLEGLASIYQLNAEKKVKSKAFAALTSLEADLQTLASLQANTYGKDTYQLVHKSPVGVLQKRRGGHPMKLVYFVSPYDLLDTANKTIKPLITEGLDVGYSVTVCMEGSSAHKLQTTTLITVNRTGKNGVPVYATVSSQNSASLPACFVLKLHQPMPMCLALIKKIQAVTEIECGDLSPPHPLLSLITQHVSQGKLDCADNRGLFINLPEQQHCYFMTDSRHLDAVLISNIPFTHPGHVPQILVYLRQQALFNSVISSCIRPNTKQGDIEKMIMMEVTALSWQQLSISLEHPLEESMATAEIDLTDITNVTCKVYTSSGDNNSNNDYATKVLQRCLSIPVTMRALIRSWQREGTTIKTEVTNDSGAGAGIGGLGGLSGGADPDIIIKQEPGGGIDPPFEPFSDPDGGCPPGLQLADSKSAGLLNLMGEQKPSKKRKRDSLWRRKQAEDCEIILDSSSSDSGESNEEMELETIESKKKSPPSIILDLENKNLVPPSVSITPITCSSVMPPGQNLNSVLGLERRPGIEIIPIVPTSLSSSITITPITKDDRSRKSGKSSKDEKSRTDKKRKRKREDSGMGPPDKLPPKQDPLMKPVSVSIKPADCGSPRPSSPNTNLRKYSSSPTPLSIVGKCSPKSVKHSPKHSPSPAYSVSSPKSSPKHGTSSPKHQSGSGSGKPSMSTLKSAVSSPKTGESLGKIKSSGSKESGRDKDRKSGSGSGHSSPKLKSSSVKLKRLDLSSGDISTTTQSGGSTPPSGGGGDGESQPQVRNRKGSLSAVIDKLKSAQHGVDSSSEGNGKSGGNKERNTAAVGKAGDKPSSGNKPPGETKVPGEYMVKPSSDGMKITINKTRTKDPSKSGTKSSSSSSGASSSGTGSPKTHTGLKPGVNSGPDSKKPQQQNSPSKPSSVKSSGKLLSSLTKTPSGLKSLKSSGSKDNKLKPTKTFDKSSSIFSSSKSDSKKSSPSALREDGDNYKVLTPLVMTNQLVVEGFMKSLDKKFQIPKLSQRTANAENDAKKTEKFDGAKSVTEQSKFIDLSTKPETKYPIVPKVDETIEPKQVSSPTVAPKPEIETPEESPALTDQASSVKEDALSSLKMDLPISSMSFTSSEVLPDVEEVNRPPAEPQQKVSLTTPQEAAEILLDFSTLPTKSLPPEKLITVPERAISNVPVRKNTPPPPLPPTFPASPSVSVHIVKSPAPSPLVIPSPHSASPCITDDELMDEALVGIGK